MDTETLHGHLPTDALTDIPRLPYPLLASGKVREIYDMGPRLLMIASDRLSAFDVVLPDGIPGKGIILTQMSLLWFRATDAIITNHLVNNHTAAVEAALPDNPELWPRAMVVRKLSPLKIEAIVRAYLSGSAWKAYRETGTVFGHAVPNDLVESSKLPTPLFTPTTKAAVGDKDLPISTAEAAELIGPDTCKTVENASLRLYAFGAEVAAKAGLILADTKFEFGTDTDGEVFVADEILTPDSSRYWPTDKFAPGGPQPAFDKQFIRDFLELLDWNKTAPGPDLPETIVAQTQDRYLEAYRRISEALA